MLNRRIGILTVVCLVLITRIQLLWEPFFHSDEALFALSAKIWRLGGIPYVDFFETKPLGVYCFYAFASWLSEIFRNARGLPDIHMHAIHLLAILWTLLTAWAICQIGSRAGSQRGGWIAAIFFVIFTTFWDPDIISVSIEVVLLLPLCLAIAILFPTSGRLRVWQSLLAGLFAAAAFLCKYQAGILLPIIFLYYWLILWRFLPGWNLRKAFAHSCLFALGFFPLLLLMLGYLKAIGSDAFDGFVFWNLLGNYLYIRDGTAYVNLWNKIVTQVFRYIASTGLLWYLTGERFFQSWRKESPSPQAPERRAYEALLWTWLFLSFIPVSVGKRFEDHYFLFLTPAFSILAALQLDQWRSEQWRRWRVAILTAMILPLVGFTSTRYLMHPLKKRLDGEEMNAYKVYADYVREKTGPADRVFVWGCAPAIYLFADRLPASRFLRTDVLAGRVSGYEPPKDRPFDPARFTPPETWKMFFEDMHRHPPTLIIDTAPTGLHDFKRYPMTSYPKLMEYLNSFYVQQPSFEGALVYRRKG